MSNLRFVRENEWTLCKLLHLYYSKQCNQDIPERYIEYRYK